MCLISMVIPVYNVEKYLPMCMENVINQTFDDFEIILVDDGSTDKGGILCDNYAKIDSRITVVHQKNMGLAAARNTGISIAKGKWLVFVDSDDIISVDYLQTLYKCVYENDAQMAFCGVIKRSVFDESDFKKSLVEPYVFNVCEDTLIELMSKDNFAYWTAWSMMVSADIVKEDLFVPGYIYEDTAVVFKWINACKRCVYIEDVMYFYRVNKNSITGLNYSVKNLDRIWALNRQVEFYANKKMFKMLNKICSRYYYICAEAYNNLLKINEIDVAKELKRKTKIHHSKYRKYISLFGGDMNYYLEVFYPHLSRIYWTLKGIENHIMGNIE